MPSSVGVADRDEHVHVRRVGDRDRLAGAEAADREHGVALVDRDRALVSLARRDDDEAAAGERVVEVALLVARLDALRVGEHPHLHEVDVGGRAGVHLRVADAAARAHALREAGVDHAVGAGAVAVRELAASTQVTISMSRWPCVPKPPPAADDVVVVDDQEPVAGVPRGRGAARS